MVKIIIASILFSASIYASHPTPEGLFRNGNNADITTDLILVKMMIESGPSEELLEMPGEAVNLAEETIVNKAEDRKPYFVKFLLSQEGEKPLQMIQVLYSNGKMEDESIRDVLYISNLKTKVTQLPQKKALFYSMLSTLAMNRSDEMSAFLKLSSKEYKTNAELVDPEKKALYAKYKSYLTLIKNDETIKETLDNPIRPQDPEVSKTVKAILQKSYLKKDKTLSLIRAQQGYQWQLKNDVLEAYFEADTLRIESLTFQNMTGRTKLSFDDYILFNGTHELPKNITIKNDKVETKVRVTSLTHLLLRDKSMARRYGEYREKYSQLNLKEDDQIKSFLKN